MTTPEKVFNLWLFFVLAMCAVILWMAYTANASTKITASVGKNDCNICKNICDTVDAQTWRLAQDKIWAGWDQFVKESEK